MKILALDTSTEVCSVALQVGDEVLTHFDDSGRKNTDIILPMIDELMAQAELKPQQLDGLSFARGPGSFTGVRVATGIAQGIAYAADLPVAPISTLAMLAYAAHMPTQQSQIYAINDARMGEVYAGAYEIRADGEVIPTVAERVCKPADIAYPHSSDDLIGLIVGTGWAAYADELKTGLSSEQWQVDETIKPDAQYLLPMAQRIFNARAGVSAEKALPVYLRDNVAKKKGER